MFEINLSRDYFMIPFLNKEKWFASASPTEGRGTRREDGEELFLWMAYVFPAMITWVRRLRGAKMGYCNYIILNAGLINRAF